MAKRTPLCPLYKKLIAKAREAELSLTVISRMFKVNHSTFMRSWTRGVPESYIGHVETLIQTLDELLAVKALPKTTDELIIQALMLLYSNNIKNQINQRMTHAINEPSDPGRNNGS